MHSNSDIPRSNVSGREADRSKGVHPYTSDGTGKVQTTNSKHLTATVAAGGAPHEMLVLHDQSCSEQLGHDTGSNRKQNAEHKPTLDRFYGASA